MTCSAEVMPGLHDAIAFLFDLSCDVGVPPLQDRHEIETINLSPATRQSAGFRFGDRPQRYTRKRQGHTCAEMRNSGQQVHSCTR